MWCKTQNEFLYTHILYSNRDNKLRTIGWYYGVNWVHLTLYSMLAVLKSYVWIP